MCLHVVAATCVLRIELECSGRAASALDSGLSSLSSGLLWSWLAGYFLSQQVFIELLLCKGSVTENTKLYIGLLSCQLLIICFSSCYKIPGYNK